MDIGLEDEIEARLLDSVGAQEQHQQHEDTVVDHALEDEIVVRKYDKLFYISGAKEQHQQQVTMVEDNALEDEIRVMKCDRVIGHKEMFNARKIANQYKSQYFDKSSSVTGGDRIAAEEAAQQDQTEEHGQVQPGDEQGGDQAGPAQGVHRLGGDGQGDGQGDIQCAGQGDGQGDGQGAGQGARQPIMSDGFRTAFRKITRARRRYSGTPDGLVQMSLVNFKFGGSSTENLGGGATSTTWNDKKRKVEHEPEQYFED